MNQMKRKLLLVLAFIALPGFANALGLGKLQLNSALNQPFDARIELLSASADELDSLNIGLADNVAFRRARIDRPFILSKLRFQLKENDSGGDYIQVSSSEAIREPFLNFLLEASWSSGRLYREYTVLLDPPLYDPNTSVKDNSSNYSPSSSSPSESYIVDDVEDDSSSSSQTTSTLSYNDNEYGPTSGSDTLWSIALQVRPDSSVSVQQMMLALLRANPDAFVNGNINGLKRGQILNIPAQNEIDSLSSQDAISDVKSQNSSWQDARGELAETVTERSESMSMSETSEIEEAEDSSEMIEDDESELRLVAASSDGAGMSQNSAGGDNESLSLANEQLDVFSQENADLKDRVRENETIIEDLKRLISLKDDELAALQQQMAAGGVVEEFSADEMFEEEVDAVEEEVYEDEVVEEPMDSDSAEQDEFMSDTSDEELVSEDEDLMIDAEDLISDDTSEITEELSAEQDEAPMEEEQAVVETEQPAPAASLLDQVLGFITGNLILIAGAFGGIILVIIALLFISRRKQNAANEPTSVAVTEFPDFEESESESETALAEENADAGVDMSEELTSSPEDVADEEVDVEGKNEFVEAPQAEVAAAPEPEEPEEDPLAEVNVFLAYEHFDQAEEFVRDAIAGSPDNLEFHAKLLEVFYAANDLKSYEDAAQVLHDKVGGEGQHWEMAQAMWQEMSPNRALFEEGGDDVAAAPVPDSTGGIMDITAEDSESESTDAGVDFDLGMDMTADAGAASGEMLDITASGEEEDLLDVTAAAGVDGSSSDEDLLDVTAAVGLDTEEFAEAVESIAADDEPMLDITAGVPEEDDALDMSHGGGEDLLDVTANANLEADDLEEDLMDVTSTGAGADGEELLEVPAEEENSVDFDIGGMDIEAADTTPEPAKNDDDNALDFDIGGMDIEAADTAPEPVKNDDDNALDFDIGGMDVEAESASDDDGGIELDLSSDGDDDLDLAAESLDLAVDSSDEISIDDLSDDSDEGLEIDLNMDEADDTDSLDIGELEVDTGDSDIANDLEIDLTLDDDSSDADVGSLADDLEIDLTLDDDSSDGDAATPVDDLEMDFDLDMGDDDADAIEIDMDGSVEMPKADLDELGMDIDDDDEDEDEDDSTVFVPRAAVADEQTSEDEIATKLDLSKAYVELGDKDSARGILDEVMADGNDEQKRTAQGLIDQLG
jgi:pilus assembly protein FimV